MGKRYGPTARPRPSTSGAATRRTAKGRSPSPRRRSGGSPSTARAAAPGLRRRPRTLSCSSPSPYPRTAPSPRPVTRACGLAVRLRPGRNPDSRATKLFPGWCRSTCRRRRGTTPPPTAFLPLGHCAGARPSSFRTLDRTAW